MIISIQTYAPKSWLIPQVNHLKQAKNWKTIIHQWQRSGNFARIIVRQPLLTLELTPHAYFPHITFDSNALFIDHRLLKQLFFGNWCHWIQTWSKVASWYIKRGFEPPNIHLRTCGDALHVRWKENTLTHVEMIDKPVQTYLNFHPNRMISTKALEYKLRYLKQLYKSNTNQAYGLIRFSPHSVSYGVHFQTFTHTLHASSDEFVWDWFHPWSYVTSDSAASCLTRVVSNFGHYGFWLQWREQACASMGLTHTLQYDSQLNYQLKLAFDISSRLFCQWPIFQVLISPNEVLLVHAWDRIEYHQKQMCMFISKHQMGVMLPWKFHLAINHGNRLCSGLSF
nr:hypothetical protein [Cyanidioschyzonaceae sp. 3]WDB00446.1 ORF340 [Cyanidiococcus yangmingshanensis]